MQRYIENMRKYHYLKRIAVKMGKNCQGLLRTTPVRIIRLLLLSFSSNKPSVICVITKKSKNALYYKVSVKMAKECQGILMTKSVGLCTQHLLPFLSIKAFIFLCMMKK